MHDVAQFLSHCPLFKGVSGKELELLENEFKSDIVEAGEHLFRSGEQAERLFVIRRGEVSLRMPVSRGERREVEIARHGPPDALGIVVVAVAEYQNTFSAVVTERATCLSSHGAKLRRLFDARSDLGNVVRRNAIELLAKRLAQTRAVLGFERALRF